MCGLRVLLIVVSGDFRDTGLLLRSKLGSEPSDKPSLVKVPDTMVALALSREWYWSEEVLESGEYTELYEYTDPMRVVFASDWVGSVLFPGSSVSAVSVVW